MFAHTHTLTSISLNFNSHDTHIVSKTYANKRRHFRLYSERIFLDIIVV